MTDLVLVRTRNNPVPGVKKNSDSGAYSGRRMPPYGLISIGKFVKKDGHSVKIFDLFKEDYMELSVDEVADRILAVNPRYVGIGSMTSQSVDAMALGDALMKKSDKVCVVHGGAHPSSVPKDTLNHGHIVVLGEGEYTMREIMSKEVDLTKRIVQGKPLTAEEMDSIPFPTKEDFDETGYDPSLDPHFPVIAARGCPYSCVFRKDGYRSSKLRFQSVDYVVDFLSYIQKTYGFKKLIVLDDIFVFSRNRMEEMADKLDARGVRFKVQCQAHTNVLNEKMIKTMHRLGIEWVYLGIESGNKEILKKIKKGITIERTERAVKLLKKNGFYVGGLYMIGNIGETVDTVNDTIRFAFNLPTDRAWFSFAAPFPGTEFHDEVDKYGEIIVPDLSKWNQVTLVYLPRDINKQQMYRLMRKAQAVRIFKKIYFTLVGSWVAPLKKMASAA